MKIIGPYHITEQTRIELLAISADYRAMLQAKREQRAANEMRSVIVKAAGAAK